MNKEEQIMKGLRDLYNKQVWLNNFKMKDSFKDYKSSEVHCIEYIGQNPDSNVTKLAESFYMTRGAISKLSKKLMEKGAIESYQRSDNKKEIYFRLTNEGQEIFNIHEKMHKEFSNRDKVVFENVSDEDFNSMIRFVNNYCSHLDEEIKKLDGDIKPE